jgi:hypothetical protein
MTILESNKEIQTTIHKHKKGKLTGLSPPQKQNKNEADIEDFLKLPHQLSSLHTTSKINFSHWMGGNQEPIALTSF